MKYKRICKHIPNLITLMNLSVGLMVLFLLLSANSSTTRILSCIFILISAFLDFLDGKLARFFNAATPIGKQFDSFADIISFGLAPMIIVLAMNGFEKYGSLIYLLFVIYVICGVVRLARYNIGNYIDYYLGLPITISGVILAIYLMIAEIFHLYNKGSFIWMTMVLIFVLSALMISSIKVNKPTKKSISI